MPTQPLPLHAEQARALAEIAAVMEGKVEGPRTFLLHGVTGSGKTEVYLQAIALALAQGKGAIVLVPEIALTPQTVERFKSRFSSGPNQTLVAVLHSHLSTGERHDEWHKIRQGRARIAIGARSAVFAPVERLGLIIVDEEHEHSYKQEEAPRYHARDVAVVRGQMEEAVVVLGSATPSMESYYNAQKKKYRLLEMPTRADDKKMPIVRVVDLRAVARKEKSNTIFSPVLKEAILQRLERKEQTMLFLNRRGFSTSLQCPLCGYVAQCPNCSLALTYHRQAGKIKCHLCGYEAAAPTVCPEPACRNPQIRYSGLGTEKVEAALASTFPHARVKRMDSDTLKHKDDYRRVLGDVRTGKTDILVGTQMIAKGLHFPNVTLVGIVHADLGLHVPDFRGSERTFQLLTQVAGRAGRGDVEGEVIVQSFTPFHPAIQYARRHDFLGFYEQEMEFRAQLKYPPLTRIALILLRGRSEEKVKFSAEYVRKELDKAGGAGEWKDLQIKGPAAAPLARAKTGVSLADSVIDTTDVEVERGAGTDAREVDAAGRCQDECGYRSGGFDVRGWTRDYRRHGKEPQLRIMSDSGVERFGVPTSRGGVENCKLKICYWPMDGWARGADRTRAVRSLRRVKVRAARERSLLPRRGGRSNRLPS